MLCFCRDGFRSFDKRLYSGLLLRPGSTFTNNCGRVPIIESRKVGERMAMYISIVSVSSVNRALLLSCPNIGNEQTLSVTPPTCLRRPPLKPTLQLSRLVFVFCSLTAGTCHDSVSITLTTPYSKHCLIYSSYSRRYRKS